MILFLRSGEKAKLSAEMEVGLIPQVASRSLGSNGVGGLVAGTAPNTPLCGLVAVGTVLAHPWPVLSSTYWRREVGQGSSLRGRVEAGEGMLKSQPQEKGPSGTMVVLHMCRAFYYLPKHFHRYDSVSFLQLAL